MPVTKLITITPERGLVVVEVDNGDCSNPIVEYELEYSKTAAEGFVIDALWDMVLKRPTRIREYDRDRYLLSETLVEP